MYASTRVKPVVPLAAPPNKVATPGSSSGTAMSGVVAGQTLALPTGTYTWNDYTVTPGIKICGLPGANAVIVGEAHCNGANITLENLTLKSHASNSHAVVDVKGNNFVGSRLLVSGENIPHVQGFIVGGSTEAPSHPIIRDTIICHIRGHGTTCTDDPAVVDVVDGGHNWTHFHAIYWTNCSSGGEISRVWMYDVSGYGLHFFGTNATNVQVLQTVTDNNLCNRGNVFDITGTGVLFDRTIINDAGPWAFRTTGSTVQNSRSQNGFNGGPVAPVGTGNVSAATTFVSKTGRDYRVLGDPFFGFQPGPR